MQRIIESCPVCSCTQLTPYLTVQDHSISGEEFDLVKCTGCGLIITQAQPDIESIGPYYASEDYISHSDNSQGLVNSLYHRVRSHMLSQKRKLVEKFASKGELLDFGTGTGYFINHMQEHGWQVLGMEPDEGAREYAHSRFGLQVKAPAALYDLPSERFDAVSMWHVMEHLHALNEDLEQIVRVTKQKGLVVVAVPNPTSSDAKRYGTHWAAYDVPRHLWHFSPESMHRLLAKHGLDVRQVRSMPFDAFYVSILSEKYRGAGLGAVRGGFAGLTTYMKSVGSVESASSLIYLAKKQTKISQSPAGTRHT